MAKKILVIDDDPLIIKTLNRYLKSAGYNIETAQSGKEALEKTEKSDFDLIISDIRMPGMDGIETLRRIRESGQQHSRDKAPAIVITGYAGGDDVYRKSEELGIVEWIYKPFELEEFIGSIRKYLRIEEPYLKSLGDVRADYELIDTKLISLTKEMENFLTDLKNHCDLFDKKNNDKQEQVVFIKTIKKEVFPQLDNYFARVWDIVKDFQRDKFVVNQTYYQKTLRSLLLDIIETNNYIYKKPLGYPGDYLMMNYIYEYNGDNNYLGESTYNKIINNYTCNIPISNSNIKRKHFLKAAILETLTKKNKARILSIACGPARELIELLKEGKINKPLVFKCLDLERRALDYIDNEIKEIGTDKKTSLSIEYICRDITGIIRDKELKANLEEQDLIYAFGIYDYLSERMASRLTSELFKLVAKGGKLIICNISSQDGSYRAYYELLGEWNMVHRDREEMLAWTKSLNDLAGTKFEEPSNTSNYLFLSINKLK